MEIDGVEVYFEQAEKGEQIEHSQEWMMNGYTGDNLTHTAVASFTLGGEDFEEIRDIKMLIREKISQPKEKNININELTEIFTDMLNHIDFHKEGYNKNKWTNEDIVKTWIRSNKFRIEKIFNPNKTN